MQERNVEGPLGFCMLVRIKKQVPVPGMLVYRYCCLLLYLVRGSRQGNIFQVTQGHPGHLVLVRCAVCAPPWGGFPSSFARQPRGCQCRMIRLRKALTPRYFQHRPFCGAGTILFQLLVWKYRPWEIGPGVCDIHGRVRYKVFSHRGHDTRHHR